MSGDADCQSVTEVSRTGITERDNKAMACREIAQRRTVQRKGRAQQTR